MLLLHLITVQIGAYIMTSCERLNAMLKVGGRHGLQSFHHYTKAVATGVCCVWRKLHEVLGGRTDVHEAGDREKSIWRLAVFLTHNGI